MNPEGLSEAARKFLMAIEASERAGDEPDAQKLAEYALGLLSEEEEAKLLRWAVLDSQNRDALVAVTHSIATGEADEAVMKPVLGRYLAGLISGTLSATAIKATMTGLAQAWSAAGPRFEFSFARGDEPGSVMVEQTEDALRIDVREDAGSTLSLIDPYGGRLTLADLQFSRGYAEVVLPDPGVAMDAVSRMLSASPSLNEEEILLPVVGTESKVAIHSVELKNGQLSASMRCDQPPQSAISVSMRIGGATVEIGALSVGALGQESKEFAWSIGDAEGEGPIPLPGLLVLSVVSES